MEKETLSRYKYWLDSLKNIDENDYNELKSIQNEEIINDLFYKDLSFGTGGLRGIMSLGSSKLNKYNIYKATEGFSLYLKEKYKEKISNNEEISVVIGYDSRYNSKEFAYLSSLVLASNKIRVYLFKELTPTPVVSFAIKKLKANGGIIITASHNPKEYNGYKVYNENAYQITLNEANEILIKINSVDTFKDFKLHSDEKNIDKSYISYINDDIFNEYINSTLSSSLLKNRDKKENFKIVYTPLNGTGLRYVKEVLFKSGFKDLIIVKEQEKPDPLFLTCPKPNPELKETLSLGLKYLKNTSSDILLATDPDADRVALIINDKIKKEIYYPSGNEIAILLLDFIINYNLNIDKVDKSYFNNKVVVRSIVSTSLIDKIAKKYNINLKTVLTGFKFIGEIINSLEKENKLDNYLLGFEESYGYLTNTDIRDKDSINASLLISEMCYFYKINNISLIDKLDSIYREYGYYKNILLTHNFDGENGMKKMKEIMEKIRNLSLNELSNILKEEVIIKEDYLNKESSDINNNKKKINLPSSDVLILIFKNETRFMIRPSGTEPKLKCYIEVNSLNKEESEELIDKYQDLFNLLMNL